MFYQSVALRIAKSAALVFLALAPLTGRADALWSEFNAKGGYRAYLAANVPLFSLHGINDEQKAFEHWKNYGRGEGRPFDLGRVRTDRPDGSPDPNYVIDGGFCWQYLACGRPYKSVVFITKDAPKPAGWDGRALLLQKGDLFNLGPDFTATAYRQLNKDVANAIDSGAFPSFASVTDHYVKYGFKEGRLTNGNWTQAQLDAWNNEAYLNQNPDVRGFFQGAQGEGWKTLGKYGFAHYMNFGEAEGRGTGQSMTAAEQELYLRRSFDEAGYRARNPDVARAIASGFFASAREHFDQGGKCEFAAGNLNRRPNDYLDNAYYLAANPDVAGAIAAGAYATTWDHWRVLGAKDGRAGLPIQTAFDENYYLAANPNIASLVGVGKIYPTALIHYLRKGQGEKRNPNGHFDETAYLARNPSIANAVKSGAVSSGFDHFQRWGKFAFAEGNRNLRPDEFFDNDFYLAANADVKAAVPSVYPTAWDHWRQFGAKAGRAGLPVEAAFDPEYYLATYPQLAPLIGPGKQYPKAFDHYVRTGQSEKRNPNAHFDETAYLARNPSIADAVKSGVFSSGFDHFQRIGKFDYAKESSKNKNVRPDDFFDNDFYLASNPDVKAAVPSVYPTAWDHWRQFGAKAGRAGLPVQIGFDPDYYLSRYPELSTLIGPSKAYSSAAAHYIAVGQKEKRNPNDSFDETYYVNFYNVQPDIDKGVVSSGYDHYQRFGKANTPPNRTLRAVNGILTVGSGANDYATIQDAINAALSGEEIRIPAGVYPNGAFGVFNKSLTIKGAGKGLTFLEPTVKSDPAVIANTGGGIAAVIGSGSQLPVVNISGLTFRKGDNRIDILQSGGARTVNPNYKEGKAGALTVRNATVTLANCEFIDNKSLTGGAIIFEGSRGSSVANCIFRDNLAQRDGGALAAFKDGLASVVNNVFENNVLEQRGYNYVHDGNTGVHITSGFRAVGQAYAAGEEAKDGEFYDRFDTGPFKLVFEPVVGPAFVGFYAGPLGGAIALNASSPLIKSNTFKSNRADFAGGGIYMIEGAAPWVEGNTFDGNQSSRGAALYSESGPVTAVILNNIIINNFSPADPNYPGSGKGAGVALYYESQPTIKGNHFENNTAGYGGGAIGIYEDSAATIEDNKFVNNRVIATNISGSILASDGVRSLLQYGIGAGGAIEVEVGDATVAGNLFDGCIARLGGSLFVVGTGSVTENTFRNSEAVAGAVGTFPGDTTLIGSAVYLNHPDGALKDTRVTVSDNVFGPANSPRDIVQKTTGVKSDLATYYAVNQPTAVIESFPSK